MKGKEVFCPNCGQPVFKYINPVPTVDIIIEVPVNKGRWGIVLILRKNPPSGWALPGGFVDYGETLEEAALREAREETGLEVEGLQQFHTYSHPQRDPRRHTISTVFVAKAKGNVLRASDDAQKADVFYEENIPSPLAFDHGIILRDFFMARRQGII